MHAVKVSVHIIICLSLLNHINQQIVTHFCPETNNTKMKHILPAGKEVGVMINIFLIDIHFSIIIYCG